MTKPINPLRQIVISCVIVLAARFTFVDAMAVRGSSMEPGLRSGQIIYVNRWAYGARFPLLERYMVHWDSMVRGDVVVFRNPQTLEPVVKRCVGIPGDQLVLEETTLFVAGAPVPISEEQLSRFPAVGRVPPNHVFVVGDSVDDSIDSRHYGFVPVRRILGRVMGGSYQRARK